MNRQCHGRHRTIRHSAERTGHNPARESTGALRRAGGDKADVSREEIAQDDPGGVGGAEVSHLDGVGEIARARHRVDGRVEREYHVHLVG